MMTDSEIDGYKVAGKHVQDAFNYFLNMIKTISNTRNPECYKMLQLVQRKVQLWTQSMGVINNTSKKTSKRRETLTQLQVEQRGFAV